MGIKSLDHYIEKHGVEKGTRVFNQLHKREETYKKSPYQRLTREWFIWRYGESEGEKKFDSHVSKSRQTLDNFVKRHGEELGTIKYQETIRKKNTVELTRIQLGEDADSVIKDRYARSIKKRKSTLAQMSDEERTSRAQTAKDKANLTKKTKAAGRTKFQIYCDSYDDGPERYGIYLQSIFKGIGSSKEASSIFDRILEENDWLACLSVYYRGKYREKEYFLSDSTSIFFYDFVVKESKTILEYDGSRWHPTQKQVEEHGDEIMEVCGISFREKYENDQKKISKAMNRGFDVFVIRSDMTKEEKDFIIKKFLDKTKEKNELQIHEHERVD